MVKADTKLSSKSASRNKVAKKRRVVQGRKGNYDVPEFRDRLRETLDARGLMQREFAEAIGRDPRTMNHYLAAKTHPDLKFIHDTGKELNVDLNWLFGLSNVAPDEGFREKKQVSVSFIDGSDNDPMIFPTQIFDLITTLRSSETGMAVVGDDSMMPSLNQGDIVLCAKDTSSHLPGIYAIAAGSRVVFRRCTFSLASNKVTLRADNAAYQSEETVDLKGLKFLGRMIWRGAKA